MSHVNSRHQRRRSKGRDYRKPLKGRWHWAFDCLYYYGHRRRGIARYRRHTEKQTWAHLRDFRCGGEPECDCPGCTATVLTTQRQRKFLDMCYGGTGKTEPDRQLSDREMIRLANDLVPAKQDDRAETA